MYKNRILGRTQEAYQLHLYIYFACLSVCLSVCITHPQWIAKIGLEKGRGKPSFLETYKAYHIYSLYYFRKMLNLGKSWRAFNNLEKYEFNPEIEDFNQFIDSWNSRLEF